MGVCCKKERVVIEMKRKNFSGKFKAKVAIEGNRGSKQRVSVATSCLHPISIQVVKQVLDA